MKAQIVIATSAVAALFAVSSISQPQSQSHSAAPIQWSSAACTNTIPQEPVVIWDSTGSTLTGLFHTRLSVYNSGLATASFKSDTILNGVSSGADFKSVAPMRVQQLVEDLKAAGAATQCDQTIIVSDVPLQTLTLASGNTDARAHTFSFYGSPEIQALIQEFLSEEFPGLGTATK